MITNSGYENCCRILLSREKRLYHIEILKKTIIYTVPTWDYIHHKHSQYSEERPIPDSSYWMNTDYIRS